MQVCAKCGERNPDTGSRCTRCGGPLAPALNRRMQQTVLGMPAVKSDPPGAPASSASQPPSSGPAVTVIGHPAPGFDPKNTMIGGFAPSHGGATPTHGGAASEPPSQRANTRFGHSPGAPLAPPELGSTAILHPGGDVADVASTMLGMVAPGPTGTPRAQPPVVAHSEANTPPSTASGGPSSQRTLLGVAVPGIAPLNPGSPAAEDRATHVPVNAPLERDLEWLVHARRQKKNAALLLGAGALLFAVLGVVLLWEPPPPLEARLATDATGKEHLELRCENCPEGSAVELDGKRSPFLQRTAKIELRAPLPIGQNDVVVSLMRPGIGRDESVALAVPVHFRVRADLEALKSAVPQLLIEVEAEPGSDVQLEGRGVPLDAGRARVPLELGELLRGPSNETSHLERSVQYRVRQSGQPDREGKLDLKIPIAPLVVTAPGPSMVTAEARFTLAGHTLAGGRVSVAGAPISVSEDGRFAQLMSIDSVGQTTVPVRADAEGHAPRIVMLQLERTADLEAEAVRFARDAKRDFSEVLEAASNSPGSTVALSGTIRETRPSGQTTVVLLEVQQGCPEAPCLVRVITPQKLDAEKDAALRVFGRVTRTVDGPAGKPVPEVSAAFSLPAESGRQPKRPRTRDPGSPFTFRNSLP